MSEEQLMTTRQVSEWLQISVVTLEQWRHRGKGPRFHRVGRSVRYSRQDIEAWMAANGGNDDATQA